MSILRVLGEAERNGVVISLIQLRFVKKLALALTSFGSFRHLCWDSWYEIRRWFDALTNMARTYMAEWREYCAVCLVSCALYEITKRDETSKCVQWKTRICTLSYGKPFYYLAWFEAGDRGYMYIFLYVTEKCCIYTIWAWIAYECMLFVLRRNSYEIEQTNSMVHRMNKLKNLNLTAWLIVIKVRWRSFVEFASKAKKLSVIFNLASPTWEASNMLTSLRGWFGWSNFVLQLSWCFSIALLRNRSQPSITPPTRSIIHWSIISGHVWLMPMV